MSGHPPSRAALAAVLLAACTGGPTLTLAAETSLRTRRNGAAHAQSWTAGAELGWSAGARATSAERSNGAAAQAREELPAWERRSACAFATTCRWEVEQREAALARAGVTKGDAP